MGDGVNIENMDDTDDMLDVFLYETNQLLEDLQEIVLAKKDEGCFDSDSVAEIFRIMHTLKGSSAIMMFDEITKTAHKLEDVFGYIRDSHSENVPPMELIDNIFLVYDFIMGEIKKIEERRAVDGDSSQIIEQLDKFLNKILNKDEKSQEIASDNENEEPKQFYIAPMATERDKPDLAVSAHESNSLGMPYVSHENNEDENINRNKALVPGDFVIQSKMPVKPNNIGNTEREGAYKKNLISVNVEKMDMLLDLIGELVIAQKVVLQNPILQAPGFEFANLKKSAGQLSKITLELQEVIMSMRMVTLRNLFQRMNRIVFDVSRKLGKEIDIEIIGEETEVDKNIIEHISDPLMHIIRNAVDHGIEMPKEREDAGKDRRGKIILAAKNEGGKVIISVVDNGRGLNRDKILTKAKSYGILRDEDSASMSDKDVYQIITYAGFSTNENVTEYSGRGVGMDVVVENVREISGSLEIDSATGQGTTMIMKIPLTLAIIDGIVLDVGSSKFVIEAGAVKAYINTSAATLITDPDTEDRIKIRGKCYPLIRLKSYLELSDGADEIDEGILLLLEHEGRELCLFVDWLEGQQEIVVKPIPAYIKNVKALSGSTQLDDGSTALILDAGGLFVREERRV